MNMIRDKAHMKRSLSKSETIYAYKQKRLTSVFKWVRSLKVSRFSLMSQCHNATMPQMCSTLASLSYVLMVTR